MDFSEILLSEFRRRKIVNPRYSVRGFARFLGVDASSLSQVLRGKRRAGPSFLRSCGKRLGLSDSELLRFRAKPRASSVPVSLDEIRYRVMAAAHHLALFELFAIPGFRPEPRIVARLLKLPVREAALSLSRLETIGLLARDSEGNLVRPSPYLTTTEYPWSSPAHRQVQGEFFSHALNALESVPYDRREHSGLTVAARSADLPLIRKRIREFQSKLNDWIESRGPPDSVYHLATAFFPLVEADSIRSTKGKRK